MRFYQNKLFLIIFTAVLVFALFFVLTQDTSAQGIFTGDTIPAGTVIENDAVLFGDDVVVAGDVQGDLFVLGNTVSISGTVEGSVFTLAQTVDLSGQLAGGDYVAAIRSTLQPDASIARNLYFIGVSLSTAEGSTVGRDLYAFTVGATLNGDIGRDLNAVIGPGEIFLYITEKFGGSSFSPFSAVPSSSPFVMTGTQAGRMAAGLVPFSWAGLESRTHASQPPARVSQAVDGERLADWAKEHIREFAALLIIGSLMAWLTPTYLPKVAGQTKSRPWASLAYGLVVFIVGFAGALLLAALIIMLAVGLAYLSLTKLAFLVGAVGLFAIGLAFFIFYLFVFYISKLVVAYLVGMLILRRFSSKAGAGRFWPLLPGLVIYILLVSVPFLGWAFAFAAILFGSGAIAMQYFQDRRFSPETGQVDIPSSGGAESAIIPEPES